MTAMNTDNNKNNPLQDDMDAKNAVVDEQAANIVPDKTVEPENDFAGKVAEIAQNAKDAVADNKGSIVDKAANVAKVACGAAKTVGSAAGDTAKGVGSLAGFLTGSPMILAIAGVVIIVALLVFNPFDWSFSLFGKPKIEKTANVVKEIKKISELTTACYFEESVLLDTKQVTETSWFSSSVDTVKNTVVVTVLCKVRAGFDMSSIPDEDIMIYGDSISIKLPVPEIFDVISNPSDYSVFDEVGEWSHEEIVAIQVRGKKKMLQNALNDKILEKANTFGKEHVKALFMALGFKSVNVILSEVPVEAKAATAVEEPVVEPATSVEPVVAEPVAVESLAVENTMVAEEQTEP